MNELQVFNFESSEVRTLLVEDEPYFVANDVARTLGYVNPSDATNKHCKKPLKTWGSDSLGRRQEFKVIPESDVYRLIFRSKLSEAEKFEDWVTEKVLPSIRKTGGYQLPTEPEDIMIETLKSQKEIKANLKLVQSDVADLKLEINLSRRQKSRLSQLVKKNVMTTVGGKKSNAYKKLYRVAVSEHWREIKNYFEVASYEEIPKLRFEEAMEIAEMWNPSIELSFEIKRLNNQIEMDV